MVNQEIPGRIQMKRFIPGKFSTKNLPVFCKMVQLNPVPVFGAKKIPVPFDENVSLKFPYHHISGFALSLALKQRLD